MAAMIYLFAYLLGFVCCGVVAARIGDNAKAPRFVGLMALIWPVVAVLQFFVIVAFLVNKGVELIGRGFCSAIRHD